MVRIYGNMDLIFMVIFPCALLLWGAAEEKGGKGPFWRECWATKGSLIKRASQIWQGRKRRKKHNSLI